MLYNFYQAANDVVLKENSLMKRKFREATQFIEEHLPESVPRDKTTKVIICTGVTVYLADVWNPFSPVGETTLVLSVAIATSRGTWANIKSRQGQPYIQTLGLSELLKEDSRTAQALKTGNYNIASAGHTPNYLA